jgi:hypothetical protein
LRLKKVIPSDSSFNEAIRYTETLTFGPLNDEIETLRRVGTSVGSKSRTDH